MTERIRLLLFSCIVFLYCCISLRITWQESLTFDEIVYQEIGRSALKDHQFSVDPYNPPFAYEITAVPGILGTDKILQQMSPQVRAFPGRMVTLAFSVVLLISVYLAGMRWLGPSGGLFAMAILAFEPTLLGHNHYITLDVIAASLWFLSVFGLSEYRKSGSRLVGVGTAAIVGLSMATKITNVLYLLPMLFESIWHGISSRKFGLGLLRVSGGLVIALLVIWATYFFRTDPIIVKHENAARLSNRILQSQWAVHFPIISFSIRQLQNTPVPLGNYLGIVKNNILRSRAGGAVFFNGIIDTPPWYAIPFTLLFKLSIPWLAGFLGASVLIIRLRNRVPHEIKVIWLLTWTTMVVSMLSGMAPLVRYLLPLIPLSALVIAWGVLQIRSTPIKWIIVLGLLWHVMGTVSQMPHLVAYANELSGPRDKRFLRFADSNLDWGQGLLSLRRRISQYEPKALYLSYFGRDDGAAYGFPSSRVYGSYKADEICTFHFIEYPGYSKPEIVAISASNWYGCGFSLDKRYNQQNVLEVVGDSILLFRFDSR